METAYYNIDNLVKFVMNGPQNFVNSFRYSNYRTDFIDKNEVDFIVQLGKFNPEVTDCSIIDDKFHIKKDYLYCNNERYKALKWEIEFKNFEKECMLIRINLKSILKLKLFNVMIEGMVIDPLIHHFLSKKSCTLVHASCVDLNGDGFIFVARGGGGKTSISTNLINRGFGFLSDNFTIITDKNTLGFIEPLNIFTYNLKNVKSDIKITEKMGILLRYTLYIISRGYIKIFKRVNPSDVYGKKIKKFTNLKYVFLIIPKKNLKVIEKIQISKGEMVDHILFNQIIEFPYFNRYITAYSYCYPESDISKHWLGYKKNLERNLNISKFYKVYVPTKYNNSTFNQILQAIEYESGLKL